MTLDISKETAKLEKETGVSQARIVQLLMAEQARQAGIPYGLVVDHPKYGIQFELYPGKNNPHRPYSMSVNKAKSEQALRDQIDQFVLDYDTPEERTKVILRKAAK